MMKVKNGISMEEDLSKRLEDLAQQMSEPQLSSNL